LEENWFMDEEKVRLTHGLSNTPEQQVRTLDNNTCPVCYVNDVEMTALSCGHNVCDECWAG